MIRPFTCFCALLAAGSGLYLYQAKHDAQMETRQIQSLMAEAEANRQRAVVVATEYQLESNPDRLTDLAGRFLPDLKPTQPAQFTTFAELDRRLPPIGLPPPAPETADPVTVYDYPRPPAAPPAPSPPVPLPPVANPAVAAPVPAPSAALIARAEPPAAKVLAPPVSYTPSLTASASAPTPPPAAPSPITSTPPPRPVARAAPTPSREPMPMPAAIASSFTRPTTEPRPESRPESRMVAAARPPDFAPRMAAPVAAPVSAPVLPAGQRYGYGYGNTPAAPVASALGMARSLAYAPAPQRKSDSYASPFGNGN